MVRNKTYTKNNPRVLISIRQETKQQLEQLYPELNTLQKKLKRIIEQHG